MNWYIEVLKKYAVFSGRARRTEYWMFFLFHIIAVIVLTIIDYALLGAAESGMGILTIIYSLAVFIPSIAVGVRRLHDTGRSGWFILIGLIPFVGFIILLVFYAQEGQSGENEYGPDPKAGSDFAMA